MTHKDTLVDDKLTHSENFVAGQVEPFDSVMRLRAPAWS
jgi:hypothetical protein